IRAELRRAPLLEPCLDGADGLHRDVLDVDRQCRPAAREPRRRAGEDEQREEVGDAAAHAARPGCTARAARGGRAEPPAAPLWTAIASRSPGTSDKRPVRATSPRRPQASK